ncbi:MAG: RNA polymerase sigma factor FliA [Pseudomonadales bacterium]
MGEGAVSAYTACEPGRDDLVASHAHLVKRIAYHLKARLPDSVQLDDLIQAGMIGLLEAQQNYDGSRGANFETFASIRIRGAMIDEVRRGDWTPRSVHKNGRKLDEAMRRAQARLGRPPQDREIAEELGVPMDAYFAMLDDSVGHKLVSFEETVEGGDAVESGGSDLGALFESSAFRERLAEAIGALPEREQLILSLYYDQELNLKEVGAVIGVGESRVSQLMSQATVRLRTHLKEWIDGG